MNARLRLLKILTSNHKHTKLNKKLLIFKSPIKPMWTYGLLLWRIAKKSNIQKIQVFQNTTLRKIINDPPYIINVALYSALKINTIAHNETKTFYENYHCRLSFHFNQIISNPATLTIPGSPMRDG